MSPDVHIDRKPLEDPVLIGLMGYAQSGKDAVAETLVSQRGFTRIAFADKLREFMYDLNPLIPGDEEGYWELAATVDQYGWDAVKERYADDTHGGRQQLQRAGIVLRATFGENILVDAAMNDSWGGRHVFSDVRFPNEVEALLRQGGQVWRVVRPGYGPVNNHVSETAVDHVAADVTLHNDGTLAELEASVLANLSEQLWL